MLGHTQGFLKNACPSEWMNRSPVCINARDKQDLGMFLLGTQAAVEGLHYPGCQTVSRVVAELEWR